MAWKFAVVSGSIVADAVALPNFDCWGDDPAPHDLWADLYDLGETLSNSQEDLQGRSWSAKATVMHDISARHLSSFLGHMEPASANATPLHDCPYGLASLRLAIWVLCRFLSVPNGNGGQQPDLPHSCHGFHASFAEALAPPATLSTLLNSRWMRPFCGLAELARPFVHASQLIEQLDPDGAGRLHYDCNHLPEGQSPSGVDWRTFRRTFTGDDGTFLATDWISKTMRFAFSPATQMVEKANECLLGVMAIVLEKLYIAQTARTEDYGKLAYSFVNSVHLLESRLKEGGGWHGSSSTRAVPADGFAVLFVTTWPILPLLCVMARVAQADTPSGRHGYQYKPFALDFFESEIIQPSTAQMQLTPLRRLSCREHLASLFQRSQGDMSETYAALLDGVSTSLWECSQREHGSSTSTSATEANKLTIFTMVWGKRLSKYLPGVLDRAGAFGLLNRYFVFCLDGEALVKCRHAHKFPKLCIPGRLQTIYNKYTFIATLVLLGMDVLYLDFDTLLLANPVPHLVAGAQNHEVLVSRDLGGECLNTGVIYIKSHPDSAALLTALLTWLWHHPYEFSQKAFSAFLGHENVTDAKFAPLPKAAVPRWTVLDPLNAFVTSVVYHRGVEGWTGNLNGIVIFHFLDGTGGVDPERAVEGRYLNLYDLFYDNPRLNLADAHQPLWEQDPRVEQALLRSRIDKVPEELVACRLF